LPGIVAERQDDLIVVRGAPSSAARAAQRRCLAGELVRLAPGIYLRQQEARAQALLVREHWVRILGELVPGSVVSYRSAYAAVPSEGILILSHPTRYNRSITLPGLRVALVKGPGPLPRDTPLGEGALHLASMERTLLENLTRQRGPEGRSRGEAAVNERLGQILAGEGREALEKLRTRARLLAGPLEMERELERLEALIDAWLPAQRLQCQEEPAPTPGDGADPATLALLQALAGKLKLQRWPFIAGATGVQPDRSHQAFVEAWFDCLDSGDARALAEARAAILGAEVVSAGSGPMRELLSAFKLAVSSPLCDSVPPFGAKFAQGLQARHALMMRLADPAVAGRFRVGDDERIQSTLAAASTLALSVPEGLARATFYLVLLCRVQPFECGNERLAHLLMNAELSSVGEFRIAVPTRMRGHLERGLDRLVRDGDPRRIIRLLAALQRWTASLDFADLDRLLARLIRMRAFDRPGVRALTS
jgi:hypothetical protein